MILVNCRRSSTVTLLCFVLSGVRALNVDIPQEQYEHARGDNITLPCRFQPKIPLKATDTVIIAWSVEAAAVGAKEIQILTYYAPKGKLDIKSSYEGRVSLDVNVLQGKADLTLSSITLADNKLFECRLLIPGDDEGKPADTARLVVLVAPSTPICNIQGKAQYGQNINITCLSEEGSPPPTYEWKSHDVQNVQRPLPPRTTSNNGVLSLYNVSRETSGYYICTSKNKIRSATCNITVTVMPPSMNIGSTAGIIAGAVAALIILVIIIYCCCCRKRKNEEEYAMGVREEEYHDKEPARNGESRYADGQEDPRAYSDTERQNRYEERNERDTDRRKDYDDRRSDYDDRRSDYDDRRSDYDDRRSDYDNRRKDYDDRRSDYDDRRSDYDDRRSDYTNRRDRHERYDDDRRYDDERRYEEHRRDRQYEDDNRYDEPYDDRERDRPPVPNNKPTRRDYDD